MEGAKIVPILKSGKPATELSSFRPVSLTSCLGKWLERVIEKRLRFVLEENKNRSIADVSCDLEWRSG